MIDDKVEGSAARTLLLVRLIAGFDGEFTLKELTARAELPTTTVHRLLQIFVQTNMVERASGQSYRAGFELLRVAAMLLRDFDVHRVAQPFLHELWLEWQETASFAVYRPASRTAIVIDTIATPHPLRYVIERFTELSLPWGSLGRSILANLPQAEVDAVIAAKPKGPLSGRQPPAKAALLEALAQIRRDGVAVYEDLSVDVAGVAAPVFGAEQTVLGCIGVTMPGSRFNRFDREALCAAVASNARRVTAAIGGQAIGAAGFVDAGVPALAPRGSKGLKKSTESKDWPQRPS